jgi:hypothetical protein
MFKTNESRTWPTISCLPLEKVIYFLKNNFFSSFLHIDSLRWKSVCLQNGRAVEISQMNKCLELFSQLSRRKEITSRRGRSS